MATGKTVLQFLSDLDDELSSLCAFYASKELLEQGYRVITAAKGGIFERDFRGAGIQVEILADDSDFWIARLLTARKISAIVKDHHISLIHCHSLKRREQISNVAKRQNIPVVQSFYQHLDSSQKSKKKLSTLLNGSVNYAISDYLSDYVKDLAGLEQGGISTIKPGIDISHFNSKQIRGHRVLKLTEKWQLDIDRDIILLPGNVQPENGHLELLKAVAQTVNRNYSVLFVGELDNESSFTKELEQEVLRYDLADRLYFGGICEDMPAAYALSKVVVIPATGPDPSGLFALQAQAMGKPVIVSNQGSLPETVMPASTGWLIPAGEIDELSRAIDLALDLKPDVRERLATRAKEFVTRQYAIEDFQRSAMQMYEKALQ